MSVLTLSVMLAPFLVKFKNNISKNDNKYKEQHYLHKN